MEVKLSPWQTKIWDDPHRFLVINVGRRSGKTVVAVLKMIEFASNNPGSTVWYISPTYKQSKSIAWLMLKEYMPTIAKPKYNEQELRCEIVNGSRIHLKGADNPDSLRGTKVDFFIFDETAFIKGWMSLWEALRPILVDTVAPAWFISTPNGLNHFYNLYNKEMYDTDYKSYHYTSYDNPYIDKNEVDKAKEEMDSLSFSQEFMAEFTRPQGTVYAQWSVDNFIPLEYDENLPLHITWDFGVNDPTAIIWIQPNKSETRVIDYYEASNADINHFVQIVNAKPYKTAELHTGDVAGNARELTTGQSPIGMLKKSGIYVRTSHIPNIKEQIRTTHAKIKSLYVSDKLERFRDCLLNYRYPQKSDSLINQSNELPIHDEYSHAMRAFEYWAWNYTKKTMKIPKKSIDPLSGEALLRQSGIARRIR